MDSDNEFDQNHQYLYNTSNSNNNSSSNTSLSSVFGKGKFKGLSKLFMDRDSNGNNSGNNNNGTSSIKSFLPFPNFNKIRSSSMSIVGNKNNNNNNTNNDNYSQMPTVTIPSYIHNHNLHNPMNYTPKFVGSFHSSQTSSEASSKYSFEIDPSLHPADVLEHHVEEQYLYHRNRRLQKNKDKNKDKAISVRKLKNILIKTNDNSNDDDSLQQTTTYISVKHKSLTDYGTLVKKIGEGASGSVTESKTDDGRIYAIKLFHTPMTEPNTVSVANPMSITQSNSFVKSINAKHISFGKQNENPLTVFQKNIIREYCVGSLFDHQNVMKTIDLVFEINDFTQDIIKMIQVMEYVPYDFFNLVMAGQMTEPEITCYIKQIINGVSYLHSMEIAHRDVKLDNCVITSNGILKIIDFGSAVTIFDHGDLIYASGIVGSDPYLAPELLSGRSKSYDPRPVDIWAIAIIYYCLIMGKFPWKAPRRNFNNFRLFSEDPDDEDDVSKGPLRILRLLPEYSRSLIGKMMELDPKARIKMDDLINDPWIRSIHCCEEDQSGRLVHKPKDHLHHLVSQDELERKDHEMEK